MAKDKHFVTSAVVVIEVFAAKHVVAGTLFTAEDVTAHAEERYPSLFPREQRRSWGPAFQRAKDLGLIRHAKHDGRPLYVPRKNGSPQPVYTC